MHALTELELELTNELLYLLSIETDDNSVLIKDSQSVIVGSSKKNGKLLMLPKSLDAYRRIAKDSDSTIFRPFSSEKHFKVLIELFMDEFMIDSIETLVISPKQYSTVIKRDKKEVLTECHHIKNCSTLLALIRCYSDITDEQFQWYNDNINLIMCDNNNTRRRQ